MERLCNVLPSGSASAVTRAVYIAACLQTAETWTLLVTDRKRLEGFHLKCQRRILEIRLFEHISSDAGLTQLSINAGKNTAISIYMWSPDRQ